MIESKHNKNALSKYKTLLNKEKKHSRTLSEIHDKKRELMKSISYPIFIKASNQTYIAHLGVDKKLTITDHSEGYSKKRGYSIKVDEEEKENIFGYGYEIEFIDSRITKKEFMEIYNKANKHLKELMALSTRSRKTILIEKTID